MHAGECCHAPGVRFGIPWRIASLLGLAAFWCEMALSRWGDSTFSFSLAGAIVCGLPWLAWWRAEVWPRSSGGRRSQKLVAFLLWFSIVGWSLSPALSSLVFETLGFSAACYFLGISLTAGPCCCLAALLIQFYQNRWWPVLSVAAVLLNFPVLMWLVGPHA